LFAKPSIRSAFVIDSRSGELPSSISQATIRRTVIADSPPA